MTTAVSNRSALEVDPRIAHEWLAAGDAVLVDVREPDEYARERIEGAATLPLSRFRAGDVPVKTGQRIVIHCKSGVRGADACRMARGGGLDAVNLAGGLDGWKAAGLPVARSARGGAAINVLRQVQLVVGVLVLAGAALGYFVHPGFLIIPAFFGAGLTFAGASGFCGLAAGLSRMPWNRVGAPAERASSIGAPAQDGSCAGRACQ